MGKKLNLIGQKFGMLTVIQEAGYNSSKRIRWLCRCDCGKYHYSTTLDLRNGDCVSCGCQKSERIGNYQRKHGDSGTKIYRIWKHFRGRCNNPNDSAYGRYGGRGIKVCKEWDNLNDGFANFKNWAYSNGYDPNLTLDRIDNDGNYEPSNCRWANRTTQARNRSITRKVDFNGNTITIKELSEQYNVNYYLLYDRIVKYKMPIMDAIQDLLQD